VTTLSTLPLDKRNKPPANNNLRRPSWSGKLNACHLDYPNRKSVARRIPKARGHVVNGIKAPQFTNI
jgi:hypothetical protein